MYGDLWLERNKVLWQWLVDGNTGISSKTMAAIAMGVKTSKRGYFRPPGDGSDFKRCYDLVKAAPFIKESFPAISMIVPEFKGILDNWDELCTWVDIGDYSTLYNRIQELTKPQETPNA